jgi:hypothetical protein
MPTPEPPGGSLGAESSTPAAATQGQAQAAAAAATGADEVQPMALSPAPSAEPQPLLGQQVAVAGGSRSLHLAPAAAHLPPIPYGMPASLYHAIQAHNLIQLGGQQALSVGGASAPAGVGAVGSCEVASS